MNNIRVKSNTSWEFGIGPGCIDIYKNLFDSNTDSGAGFTTRPS